MRVKLLRNYKGGFHHPVRATASSILRGRHLEPEAIKEANRWRASMVALLLAKPFIELTAKERHLIHNLMAN